MTRVKPTTRVIAFKSLEDVDKALGEIAEYGRDIAAIEADMNARIDAAKAGAAEAAAPLQAAVAVLEAAIARYAEGNKAELFSRRKSRELTFGHIGFRVSTKLKLLAKHTWERVLQNLRDNDLRDLIRVKEEPDKEAMKSLTPEHLKDLGCKVVQKDVFYYELKIDAVGVDG